MGLLQNPDDSRPKHASHSMGCYYRFFRLLCTSYYEVLSVVSTTVINTLPTGTQLPLTIIAAGVIVEAYIDVVPAYTTATYSTPSGDYGGYPSDNSSSPHQYFFAHLGFAVSIVVTIVIALSGCCFLTCLLSCCLGSSPRPASPRPTPHTSSYSNVAAPIPQDMPGGSLSPDPAGRVWNNNFPTTPAAGLIPQMPSEQVQVENRQTRRKLAKPKEKGIEPQAKVKEVKPRIGNAADDRIGELERMRLAVEDGRRKQNERGMAVRSAREKELAEKVPAGKDLLHWTIKEVNCSKVVDGSAENMFDLGPKYSDKEGKGKAVDVDKRITLSTTFLKMGKVAHFSAVPDTSWENIHDFGPLYMKPKFKVQMKGRKFPVVD
ncbi:uncharacterized protein LY89DRAFT_176871 [Mollisia scopiformis]|uniref:Uncharacterized protein n=1 Tax=Mollisia scopiformis TaxID=149040 RepID=A0A194XT58_MOLSC|nr:uncharacterized protein LY89DRAFT_176871 [Mollisia scopiformis]KUJ23234.1 hypothetical protein LY89DRAFT_176871 [Mollisia scopiformis]